MAISRSLMNRQLQAGGGIMKLSQEGIGGGDYKGIDMGSRTGFGILKKIGKRVRKLIPNEVAEIATKAAPFVAPFNPALAGAMAGIGSFDQTGSIGDAFKRGALTYGGGQAARYLGGAGFQGNPFQGGLQGTLQNFSTFSSPIGTETGLGKFFSNRGAQPIQGVTADAEPVKSNIAETFATADSEPVASKLLETSVTADTPAVVSQLTKETVVNNNPGFLKTITEGFKNKDYSQIGNAVLDQTKKFGKAMFTNKDGSIDKAAVMGALAFTSSYIEAKALAEELGVDEGLTEAEYDELTKAEKKDQYADYLTNFFAGRKDGGRIGFAEGTPDYSDNMFLKLIDKISPLFVDEKGDYRSALQKAKFALSDFIAGKGYDYTTGAEWYNKLDEDTQMEILLMKQKIRDNPEAYSFSPRMKELTEQPVYDEEFAGKFGIGSRYAEGGRIGFKKGSPEEPSEIGIMTIDVEAGDDEEDMDDLMAGITFSSAEKSYLFRRLGGAGGASRSYTMPQLYRILSNPNRYATDAAILKEIAIMGMKKDGGRIGYKGGANRVSELLVLRDSMLAKDADADVSDIDAEIFQLTGKVFRSVGGIGDVPTGKLRQNNAGVIERDYRDEGGFVPVGIKERADDVPAMLSKNEFVMTADAVRGIGGGDVEKGSKKLYKTMKQAEKVGKA